MVFLWGDDPALLSKSLQNALYQSQHKGANLRLVSSNLSCPALGNADRRGLRLSNGSYSIIGI
jgi:hypothetical protein